MDKLKFIICFFVFSLLVVFVQVSAYELDYDDDYTYSTGDSDDGVVWGGGYIDVGADGTPWYDKKVICYDWGDDGIWDGCYGSSQSDFDYCMSRSNVLTNNCNMGICHTGYGIDQEFYFNTGNPGDRWYQTVHSRLYDNCEDGSDYYYDDEAETFYVISPRQYGCNGNGGTYYDFGYASSSYGWFFDNSISCGSNWGCDESKDDSNADFGYYGTSKPDKPCSLFDGHSDCDSDSDCFPGSHCSMVIGYDYCCPDGQDWRDGACREACTPGEWLDEWDCSGDMLRRKRISNADCDTEWVNYEDCNGADSWECNPDNSCIYFLNGFCHDVSGYNDYCETEMADYSCKGDGDFCSMRKSHSNACGLCVWGDYDCDSDSECNSNLECLGPILGRMDGCCHFWEEWDEDNYKCVECVDNGDCGSAGDWEYYDEGANCVNRRKWVPECNDNECGGSWEYDGWGSCKGDEDYCDDRKTANNHNSNVALCGWGDYDCDYIGGDECDTGKGLSCKIVLGIDGCCYSTERWDSSLLECCVEHGDKQCIGNDLYWFDSCGLQGDHIVDCDDYDDNSWTYYLEDDCVKKKRRDYYCGSGTCPYNWVVESVSCLGEDDYCTVRKDQGLSLCEKNDYDCDRDDECAGSLICLDSRACCENGEIWKESEGQCKTPEVCGDGICEDGEICVADCLNIGVLGAPGSVYEGEDVTFDVQLENVGSEVLVYHMEAAIFPTSWLNWKTHYGKHASCCDSNEYVDAAVFQIDPGDSLTIPFEFTAPNQDSIDHCNNLGSAWSDDFTLVAGVYRSCGGGYRKEVRQDIEVLQSSCDFDGLCESGEDPTNCGYDCGCNNNEVCEYDRDEPDYSCDDCGCNNNGVCEWYRDESVSNCADCDDDCDIPDGSSFICSCDNDLDCEPYGDYYCNQYSGWGACEPIFEDDECFPYHHYFCETGWVMECYDGGDHWAKQKFKDCNGKHSYCDPMVVDGLMDCSTTPHDVWLDYADVGVKVNKQRGDVFKLNIQSLNTGTRTIYYSQNVFESDCYGEISVAPGITTCDFTVLEDAPFGEFEIDIDDKIASIDVLYDPEMIIVTDSEKLGERFIGETSGVDAVLKQTYATAVDNAVVYDLANYDLGEENPFGHILNYREKVGDFKMEDNSYSLAVGEFIRDKCDEGCENVMVVGDDYVVPGYRRGIPTMDQDWFLFETTDVEEISTDVPYIKKVVMQWSGFDELFKINGKFEGKDVLLILPDVVNDSMRMEIDRLKQALNDSGYNPDFDEMNGMDTYCVDDRWFTRVKDRTLIIIGTEENNNAFKCMPFVSGDVNRDAAFLQPNIWDTNEYALVINTNDVGVIAATSMMIEKNLLVELKGENLYYFHVGTEVASYVSLGVGLVAMTVGTGGVGAPIALATAASVLDVIADGSDLADTCVLNKEGNAACAVTLGFTGAALVVGAVPGAGIAKKGVKLGIRHWDDLPNSVRVHLILKLEEIEKIPHGSKKILKQALRRQDTADVVRGYEAILGDAPISELKVLKNHKGKMVISESGLSEGLESVGKISDTNADIPQKFYRELKTQGDNPGLFAQAKRAAEYVDDPYYELKAVEKNVELPADLFPDPRDQTWKIDVVGEKKLSGDIFVEEVKNGQNLDPEKINLQIDKLAAVRDRSLIGSVSEARIAFRKGVEIPQDILNHAIEKNIKVRFFDGIKEVSI